MPDAMVTSARFCLRAAERVDDEIAFAIEQADTEQLAVARAALLARRGVVVWLRAHRDGDSDHRSCEEIGMFVDDRFLPVRAPSPR